MDTATEFELHAARAFFASAWADACEEAGQSRLISGREIMDVMPAKIDPAALHAARTLRFDLERANGLDTEGLLAYVKRHANGDRPATAEWFGHYCAMQAMGHGVGLHDAFGGAVYERVTVPYVDFGNLVTIELEATP